MFGRVDWPMLGKLPPIRARPCASAGQCLRSGDIFNAGDDLQSRLHRGLGVLAARCWRDGGWVPARRPPRRPCVVRPPRNLVIESESEPSRFESLGFDDNSQPGSLDGVDGAPALWPMRRALSPVFNVAWLHGSRPFPRPGPGPGPGPGLGERPVPPRLNHLFDCAGSSAPRCSGGAGAQVSCHMERGPLRMCPISRCWLPPRRGAHVFF